MHVTLGGLRIDLTQTGPAHAPNNVILIMEVDEPFLGRSNFGANLHALVRSIP